MSRWKLALHLLLLANTAICFAEAPHVFSGQSSWDNPGGVIISPEEYLLDQTYFSGYLTRGFNYNGNLDDGTVFAIHLSQWRYGILNGWVVAFLVVTPDNQLFVYEDRLREKAVSMNGSRYTLRFEEGWFDGDKGDSSIHLELEGLACDLSVQGILPPWKPGDGQAFFPSSRQSFTRLVVPSPWASVSGWLRLGGRLITASGQCYADRSLHSYPLRDFTNRTFYFRTFSPGYTAPEERWMLCLQVYETHSVYGSLRMPLLLLARGREWVFTSWDFDVEQPPAGGADLETHSLPLPLRLAAHCAGYELQGEFVVTRVFHISDVEQKLPGILRGIAAAFFKRPVFYRLQGYFSGTLRGPEGFQEDLLLPGQGNYAIFDE